MVKVEKTALSREAVELRLARDLLQDLKLIESTDIVSSSLRAHSLSTHENSVHMDTRLVQPVVRYTGRKDQHHLPCH